MDRFVTRTPTWKTLNYTSMAAGSQRKCLTKNAPVINKKTPLQQKQLNEVPPHMYDFDFGPVNLLPVSSRANAENSNANSSDSGLSSASNTSPQHKDDNAAGYNAASCKELFTPTKNHFSKLADYIDCPHEKENDTHMTITRTPKSHKKAVESGLPVQRTLEVKRTLSAQVKENATDIPLPKATNMIMARIQRDLNSPSAAARMKAINALKSPTKSAYSHFDIPEAEQSLHLPEPPSLQEIMRNIVVYVEVRSGEDNRSAGVRKVIEAMGARICLSLNRETTHVVFKDGLMSTFKKATQMNLPIVSILWIEACKNQRRICDPKDFPISNLDRYENPELYTKIKRVKCMQPDSECNKRIRAKAGGTPKDATPTQKTGNLKKTSTFIGGTPTSSTLKKKTDISQFFKKIERPTPTSGSKDDGATNGITLNSESPATKLLNLIHSECYTPLEELKSKTATKENNNNIQKLNDDSQDAKKALDFFGADKEEIKTTITASPLQKASGRPRRNSLMPNSEIERATTSLNTMTISSATPTKCNQRRRSSSHVPEDRSTVAVANQNSYNMQPIQEERMEEGKDKDKNRKLIKSRRTLYTVKTMEQSDLLKSETSEEIETSSTKSTRRRTLYTSTTMETSDVVNKVLFNASNRRRTCFNLKDLELTQIGEGTESKAANTPNKGIGINSKNVDLTNAEETNTPASTKTQTRRRTLFGAQIMSETNITTSKTLSCNDTARSSVSLTAINFQTGKIASSTLLDDGENRSKLVATPPAEATIGKLLEETEQCATPLVFSSSRRPGNKRRSLFDVSMDIITQRLQCINQSARRSLAPPAPSAEVVNTIENQINTPKNIANLEQLLNSATPKSSTEILNICTNSNDGMTTITAETTNISKKRRKLFMPNEVLDTPTSTPLVSSAIADIPEESAKSDHAISNTNNSAIKRRRTLMPISQPQPTTSIKLKDSTSRLSSTSLVRKRRSTLDFEQIQNTKTKAITTVKDSSSNTKNSRQQQIKSKKAPILVYTNMHQQQIDVIHEAINKLRLFVLESCVSDTTTHLVSLEPRRTLNLLRALVRGLWILDYSWIADSLKSGKWLPEESYELQDFSRAIEICRSERQAFGNKYKCDLFLKFGTFYISSKCCPISKENMCELITLCGGHVVNSRQKARYIIGDSNRTLANKFCLSPYWVLDSITQMQLMKVNKYINSIQGQHCNQGRCEVKAKNNLT